MTHKRGSLAAMTPDDWRFLAVFWCLAIIVGVVFAAIAGLLR